MGWKTDETIRNKAQKFKEDYSRLFDERHESMKRIVDVVVPYMKQEHLWEDREAILNVICVLPSCHFRFYMYSHYYEITDKPHEIITNPDCGVWKVDREILLKIQDFADDYEEKSCAFSRWRILRRKKSSLILKKPDYGTTCKRYMKYGAACRYAFCKASWMTVTVNCL